MAKTTSTVRTLKKERPLSAEDRKWHLSIYKRVSEPHASGRVIRMNSTYLELADSGYANRGMMSSVSVFGIGLIIYALTSIIHSVVFLNYLNPNWDHHDEFVMLSITIPLTLFLFLFISGIVAFNRKIGEWFGYTHYPVRFNRLSRIVYVFRGDGTVLEAPWDHVYFTLTISSRAFGVDTLAISGMVLKDPTTVEETFFPGYVSSSRDYCLRHWEFIRRYMEEGPQAVVESPGLNDCLPIADKRETLYQGWIALASMDAGNPFIRTLMTPFHALFFIGRLVCRMTCKVPLWPTFVEGACTIRSDDQYVRDSGSNPEGYR